MKKLARTASAVIVSSDLGRHALSVTRRNSVRNARVENSLKLRMSRAGLSVSGARSCMGLSAINVHRGEVWRRSAPSVLVTMCLMLASALAVPLRRAASDAAQTVAKSARLACTWIEPHLGDHGLASRVRRLLTTARLAKTKTLAPVVVTITSNCMMMANASAAVATELLCTQQQVNAHVLLDSI